jgi:hypothetical protein
MCASEIDATLRFYTGLERMLDFSHFTDKIGVVHQFSFSVAASQDNTRAANHHLYAQVSVRARDQPHLQFFFFAWL